MSWICTCGGGAELPVGVGAAITKSVLLSSVSGALVRLTEVVFVVAGAGEPSRTTVAGPQPTRSTIAESAAQSAAVLQVSASVELTSATVPPVLPIAIEPLA